MYKLAIGGESRQLDFSTSTLAEFWEERGEKLRDLADLGYIDLTYKGACQLAKWAIVNGGSKVPAGFDWKMVTA